MNVETFNSRYRIGTPVFAYPGCRPEDGADTRLVTRTRTVAQVSACGTDVVWVEGEGSYIALSHVDPVSESVWQAAKQAEETAAAVAAMPLPAPGVFRIVVDLENADDYDDALYAAEQAESVLEGQGYKAVAVVDTERETAAAEGALPVPVGDQPQPLDDTQLAEYAALIERTTPLGAATASPGMAATLLAEVQRLNGLVAELETQRERRRIRLIALQNDALNMRGSLSPMGGARKVPFPLGETLTPAVDWLIGRVTELEAERHTTNEALADAAETLRANRDRIAELEENLRAVNAGWAVARSRVAELEKATEQIETVRALCDAADHAGISSGGWFTVDAVRRAITPTTDRAEEAAS